MMNSWIYNADWRTHAKVLAIGLLFAGIVAVVGAYGRIGNLDLGTAPLVKAGGATLMTDRLSTIQ
jgi:hypothetical protein